MISISYIIPTYNNLKLLRRCIDSIINQSDEGDKIIIVDDGSKDETFEFLISKYSSNNKFLILKQKNSGSGAARNYGVKMATSDYIWFVDSDDLLQAEAINKVKARLLSKENTDILFFNYIRKTENDIENVSLNIDIDNKISLLMSDHFPWNKVIRRSLFSSIEFPNIKMRFQDHATIPKVICKANKIDYITEYLYVYDFSHDSNISKNIKKNKDIYLACDYLIEDYHKGNFTSEEIEAILFKTLVFDIFNSKLNKKDLYLYLADNRRYLNENLPMWKFSKFLKTKFISRNLKLTYYRTKLFIGKLLKMPKFVYYPFILMILNVKNLLLFLLKQYKNKGKTKHEVSPSNAR